MEREPTCFRLCAYRMGSSWNDLVVVPRVHHPEAEDSGRALATSASHGLRAFLTRGAQPFATFENSTLTCHPGEDGIYEYYTVILSGVAASPPEAVAQSKSLP